MAAGTVADWVTALEDYGFGEEVSPDTLLGLFNSVIQDVNTRMVWSFLEATAQVTVSAATVPLPARFNKARSFVIDAVPQILVPSRRETILKRFVGNLAAVAVPQYYYFVGQSMFVYPAPDKSYTATLDYYQDETAVTFGTVLSSLLLPVKHQDVYLLGILQRLYSVEDDALSNMFGGRFEKKIVDMMEDATMHQYDMPDVIVDTYEDWG